MQVRSNRNPNRLRICSLCHAWLWLQEAGILFERQIICLIVEPMTNGLIVHQIADFLVTGTMPPFSQSMRYQAAGQPWARSIVRLQSHIGKADDLILTHNRFIRLTGSSQGR